MTIVVRDAESVEFKQGLETVATLLLSTWSDGMCLYRLYVSPTHRKQGYARELMLGAIEHAKPRPLYLNPIPFADEEVSREVLTRLYESLGFATIDKVDGELLMKLETTETPDGDCQGEVDREDEHHKTEFTV